MPIEISIWYLKYSDLLPTELSDFHWAIKVQLVTSISNFTHKVINQWMICNKLGDYMTGWIYKCYKPYYSKNNITCCTIIARHCNILYYRCSLSWQCCWFSNLFELNSFCFYICVNRFIWAHWSVSTLAPLPVFR